MATARRNPISSHSSSLPSQSRGHQPAGGADDEGFQHGFHQILNSGLVRSRRGNTTTAGEKKEEGDLV